MTDFRALCAELLDELVYYTDWSYAEELKDRARAALADGPAVPEGREPASVTGQPSDEEIMELMPQQMHEDLADAVRAMAEREGINSTAAKGVMRIMLNRHVVDLARAVLARWGNPAPQPVPVSERPWEREGWCAEDGRCWVWNRGSCAWWELVDSKLISYSSEDYTHCLPAHALPIPHQQENAND